MVKKATLINHLDPEELYHFSRCSSNAISRGHHHIIALLGFWKNSCHY
jgi:hypothetical protein